jgi:hypothetical protein
LIKVSAHEVAPSLRFASAKITKASRSRPAEDRATSGQAADADLSASDAPGYPDEPPW